MANQIKAPINYPIIAGGKIVSGGSVLFGQPNVKPDEDNPSTLKAVYLDAALSKPAENPQGVSSDGVFDQSDTGILYGPENTVYSIVIKGANKKELSYIPEYDLNDANAAAAAQESATDASNSASSALTSKNLVEALYTDFTNRYFGAFSSDPSVDDLGNPPSEGSIYFNSTSNVFFTWTDGVWVDKFPSNPNGLLVTATGTTTPRSLAEWTSKETLTYNSIAEAKADNKLDIGQSVKTLGYYSAGDGGGADYTVISNGTGSDDGGSYHDMDNGNQLKLIAGTNNLNPKVWGALADAQLSGSRYVGTDLAQFLQKMVNYINSNGAKGSIKIPYGDWVIAAVEVSSSFAVTYPGGNNSLDIEVKGDTGNKIYIDGATSITPTISGVFGNANGAQIGTSVTRGENGTVRFSNLNFEGVLGKTYDTAGNERFGADLFRFGAMECIEINGCSGTDLSNKFSTIFGANSATALNNNLNNVASDGIRFIETPSIVCKNNRLKYVDDDSIALHSNVNITSGVPCRDKIICSDNIVEDSEGILILGGKNITCSGNVLTRTHGTALVVGFSDTTEGRTSITNINITGNIVTDAINRFNPSSGLIPDSDVLQASIILAGRIYSDASGTPTRENGGVFLQPFESGSSEFSYNYNPNGDVAATMGAFNVIISNNILARTLPSTGSYSDWGYGRYLYRGGDVDPAVNDGSFLFNAILIKGDVKNYSINNNVISGFQGHGVRFDEIPSTQTDNTIFSNGLIHSNIFENILLESIDTSWKGGAVTKTMDVSICNNVFDSDPYFKSSYRNPSFDGTWTITGSRVNIPAGINNRQTIGMKINNNNFKNTYLPVVIPPTDSNLLCEMKDNSVYCDPDSFAESGLNKGVAEPGSGAINTHIITDCNPLSGTYGQVQNVPLDVSSILPTNGKYVQGKIVNIANPTGVSGQPMSFVRLTTGSSHVDGVDWKVINF